MFALFYSPAESNPYYATIYGPFNTKKQAMKRAQELYNEFFEEDADDTFDWEEGSLEPGVFTAESVGIVMIQKMRK